MSRHCYAQPHHACRQSTRCPRKAFLPCPGVLRTLKRSPRQCYAQPHHASRQSTRCPRKAFLPCPGVLRTLKRSLQTLLYPDSPCPQAEHVASPNDAPTHGVGTPPTWGRKAPWQRLSRQRPPPPAGAAHARSYPNHFGQVFYVPTHCPPGL